MTRKGLDEFPVSGVWLVKEGSDVVVKVEIKLGDGTLQWVEIIREHQDGPFSHIAEPEKIRSEAVKGWEKNRNSRDRLEGDMKPLTPSTSSCAKKVRPK